MYFKDNKKLNEYFKVVIDVFNNFKNNLVDKSLLIIYENRQNKKIEYIIVSIRGYNFYHLTGLIYKEDSGNSKDEHFGSRFYGDLCDKRLSVEQLKIKDNNTNLKIKALPSIAQHCKYIKMIGDFNNNGIKLKLDKVAGNNNVCLGLKRIGYKEYAPASCLYNDVREYINTSNKVVAIFSKNTDNENKFNKIEYIAKGINLNDNILCDNIINDLIDISK